MNTVVALMAIASFFFCMRLFGVMTASIQAISIAKQAANFLRSSSASDDEKEVAARRFSLALLLKFASILVRTGAALLVAAVLILVLAGLGLVAVDNVGAALESWTVIIVSLALIPILVIRRR